MTLSTTPNKVSKVPPLNLESYRYDLRAHHVKDVREGRFYTTRFASPQGALIPRTPADTLVVYRPKSLMRQVHLPAPAQQLWLFEQVHIA